MGDTADGAQGGGDGGAKPGGKKHHRSTTPARPPSTFGCMRPEPKNRMVEGLIAPRHDAMVFERLYNYRSHVTSRKLISTYDPKIMYGAVDVPVSQPQPPMQLHYSFHRGDTAAASSSRPVSPSASHRNAAAGRANMSATSSSNVSSNNGSFSGAADQQQLLSSSSMNRSSTPKICRTPLITSGKFQDVTTPRRSGTPTIQRGPADDTRVSHNSELLGGVCPGSWKETSRWVLALRNSDVVFKKRPLMCAKKRAEWEQQRRSQLFSSMTGTAASVSVGAAAADAAGSAPPAAAAAGS